MSILNNVLKLAFPSSSNKSLKKEEELRNDVPVTDKDREVPPNREVLLSWSAPSRPFTQRDMVYYKKILSIIFVLSIILVLAGQFLLIGLIVSIAVLFYVLSSVPPEIVMHEIDNYGIHYLGKEYYWVDLKFYFFTERSGYKILNVDTKEPYPGRLFLLLENVEMQKIKDVMEKHLPMREEPPQTFFDKALKQISARLSL